MKFPYLRWMIRAALLSIVAGAILGVLMILGYRFPAFRWLVGWRSVHVHLMLLGGVIQMIMGVALWMFPRRPEQPHWPTSAQGWTLFGLLNGGMALRICASVLGIGNDAGYAMLLAGSAGQATAIVYFLVLVIPRVRGPRETPA